MWTALFVIVSAAVVVFCPAQIIRLSFEETETHAWEGPYGGGSHGGQGGGVIVSDGPEDFVRTGKHAVRLDVWDDGSSESIAWAGITQRLPCDLRRSVRAAVWLYFSSSVRPLTEGTCALLRIEYFEDPDGLDLIAQHMYVSKPLRPDSHSSDVWHQVEARDRIPTDAKSLRVSIVLTGQGMAGKTQAVWVDDLCVEVQPVSGTNRKPCKRGDGPDSVGHYAFCRG